VRKLKISKKKLVRKEVRKIQLRVIVVGKRLRTYVRETKVSVLAAINLLRAEVKKIWLGAQVV